MKGEPGQTIAGPRGIDGVDGAQGDKGEPGAVGAKGEEGTCIYHAQWYMMKLHKKPTGNKVSFRILLKDQESKKVSILHSDTNKVSIYLAE